MKTPDIGSVVSYKGKSFRVNGWLREICTTEDPVRFNHIHCRREEATHVSLAGGTGYVHAGERHEGGAIVSLTECRVTGMVAWPTRVIDRYRTVALARAGRFVVR